MSETKKTTEENTTPQENDVVDFVADVTEKARQGKPSGKRPRGRPRKNPAMGGASTERKNENREIPHLSGDAVGDLFVTAAKAFDSWAQKIVYRQAKVIFRAEEALQISNEVSTTEEEFTALKAGVKDVADRFPSLAEYAPLGVLCVVSAGIATRYAMTIQELRELSKQYAGKSASLTGEQNASNQAQE